MSRYSLAADWQSEEPWSPGARWEVAFNSNFNEQLVTLFARLYVDYSPGELEDDVRPASGSELVFSYGETEGELLTIDDLTGRMDEELSGDLVLARERDRLPYFASLAAPQRGELLERLAG